MAVKLYLNLQTHLITQLWWSMMTCRADSVLVDELGYENMEYGISSLGQSLDWWMFHFRSPPQKNKNTKIQFNYRENPAGNRSEQIDLSISVDSGIIFWPYPFVYELHLSYLQFGVDFPRS